MGAPKMNTIADPLGQQKTAAANLGLQNYQTASSNIPTLQNSFTQNYGQTPGQTLGGMDPLFQQTYGAVSGDVTGQGGPFTSLQKNLLGAFDQQANSAQAAQNAQLQQEGIYSSGLGMGANNNLQANLATQRGALSSQVGTQELQMADTLSQQLMQQNQLMGYTNPLNALMSMYSLSTPPNFQNVNNSYYTPAPTDTGFQTAFGDVTAAANAAGSVMSGMGSMSPSTVGSMSPSTGSTQSYMPFGMNPNNYSAAGAANTPGLSFASM